MARVPSSIRRYTDVVVLLCYILVLVVGGSSSTSSVVVAAAAGADDATNKDSSDELSSSSSPSSSLLSFQRYLYQSILIDHTIHPLWLRERCVNETFYADPDTKQSRYNLHEEIDNLSIIGLTFQSTNANHVNDDDDGQPQEPPPPPQEQPQENDASFLMVTFSDNRTCHLSLEMLQYELNPSQEYFLQANEWDIPTPYLWDSTFIAPRMFEHDDIVFVNATKTTNGNRGNSGSSSSTTTNQQRSALQFVSTLLSTGIAVVSNVPQIPGQCTKFGSQFSTIRDTEWGIFNVRSTPDSDNGGIQRKDLAYTTNAIGMHIDNAYRVDTPPAFQLLHAMEHCDPRISPDDCQVHNKFVDGFAVAQALCTEHRDMFDILTTTVLRWENNGGDGSSLLFRYAPMIELARNNNNHQPSRNTNDTSCPKVEAISFSAKSGGYAPNLESKDDMDLFYRAKRKFSSMLHSPQYTIQSQLFPGALVIFDNRRILHSRSAIAKEDGPRWLQGCYIDRDGLMYLHERLRRQVNKVIPSWHSLREATVTDFDRMGIEYDDHVARKTMDNLIGLLESQKEAYLGAPVSLYEHNLQTASRALRDGQDDETVVVSLLHDIFETLAVKNHGELAASMLAPWISPRSQWLLAHHEVFQGYYYFDHYGVDKNTRDIFIDSPYYNWTIEWCETYDQASFDKDYPTMPLQVFLPVLQRVLGRNQYWWNPTHPKARAVSAVDTSPNEAVADLIPSSDETDETIPDSVTRKEKVLGETIQSDVILGTPVHESQSCSNTWTCYG